jgi:hypothetical protein
VQRQLIPEGLAEMAPGPELAALLDGMDIRTLTGDDLVDVLRARARQLSHEQARLLATMAELAIRDPDAAPDEVARLDEPAEFAADEIRAALAWTRTAADRELGFAETLTTVLPRVFAALECGQICRSKAWVFADLLAGLSAEHRDAACARLLPVAGRLTTGELAARLKRLVIALDPGWAARRYATAVRGRNVIGYLAEDGSATITGTQLPADHAATACAHVEGLAKAAKRAGHPGRVGSVRADVYLGLLNGRWQHLTRDQIISDLLAGADRTQDTAKPPAQPTQRPSGVELRVKLSTLLGRDRHPGEIAGWGPVTAETARSLAAAQRGGEWRYAVTDAGGHLLRAGITRRRPDRRTGPSRGGVVELHVPAAQLAELAAQPGRSGPWAPVIRDLAAQNTGHAAAQDPTARFAGAGLRRHVQIRDRRCVGPGCRCPARDADLDHTVDHARGGLTVDTNTGPLCRHDHRLKHEGGWRLHQTSPGHFTWISPLGRRYDTRPQPIDPGYAPPQPP